MIESELKYFQAKSLKLVLPLVFPPDLIQRFVVSTPEGVPSIQLPARQGIRSGWSHIMPLDRR